MAEYIKNDVIQMIKNSDGNEIQELTYRGSKV